MPIMSIAKYQKVIFPPAHDVEGDVPLANMLAFIEAVQNQPGFVGE